MKNLVIGILAHVDAGKTTLAESILYLTGSIRKLGRVDHKDAFLDTNELERARGITIFSKQAKFQYKNMDVSLLDTPGHVDFSAEMERTLQVLDYAILIISGSDGVQGHTKTLWRLLERYGIPTFLFINKMDLDGSDQGNLMQELKKQLNDSCVDFSSNQSDKVLMENIALCDEAMLEKYMDNGMLEANDIATLVATRKVFPCYFGSALKLIGIEEFLNGLEQYTLQKTFSDSFGAKVYKIARDEQGNRLTYMKITGGSLKVKMPLSNRKQTSLDQSSKQKETPSGNAPKLQPIDNSQDHVAAIWEEKVDQIRIYSGAKYETVDEAEAGVTCAVTGLSKTYPGEGLGIEAKSDVPVLEPVLKVKMILPPDCNAFSMLSKLRQLEEEDPLLRIVWSEQLKEIHVQLMGEVQIEVLKSLILERFGVNVEFGSSNIVYKETILEPVIGVGHFEPLRHYAEVHLLLEPLEHGSGLHFASRCSEDELDRNWQRLVLTHLEEKEHLGVLTGSPITDMKITLIAGRAHLKHTEGGDFREATYRAVRHGLKKANSILLEPYYNFTLEIPTDYVGRAMADIQRLNGRFNPPETFGEMAVLTGYAPVATMMGYQTKVAAYTGGIGRLYCNLRGYLPCHNADEVIEAIGYDSERDLENPTGSVFCANGAGFIVEWDKVEDYMHLEHGISLDEPKKTEEENASIKQVKNYSSSWQEDKELEAIFTRTYGPIKRKLNSSQNILGHERSEKPNKQIVSIKQNTIKNENVKEYLLVDGYNIIFSWNELRELANDNMDAARIKLMDILCNYQGFKKCTLILVFDAYKVKGGVGEVQEYHNIHVVYTKEAETADQYIEKVSQEMARKHHVTVATSDSLEQLIILGKGAVRLSAKELKEEITRVNEQIKREYLEKYPSGKTYIGEQFDDDLWDLLE